MASAVAKAKEYANQAWADNTKRAYRSDWSAFEAWCNARSACALPASSELVAAYLADQAEILKASTLQRRLAAIRQVHRIQKHEPPMGEAIRVTLRGIRRVQAMKGRTLAQKEPVTKSVLLKALAHLPTNTRKGVRDRAILLLGYITGMRRSEVAALNYADIERAEVGVWMKIRLSKGDKSGVGQKVLVVSGNEDCPIAALNAWIEVGPKGPGPLFCSISRGDKLLGKRLSPKDISRVVKDAVASVGLDAKRYGAHSLRSGIVTDLANRGTNPSHIAAITRHRSMNVLHGYYRDAEIANNHPVKGLL